MTRLTLHSRIHLADDEKVTTSQFVACPEDKRWVPVEGCRRCVKCKSISDETITCEPEAMTAASMDPESAPIADVMDPNVLCIDSHATVEIARRVMDEQDAPIAIVLDGNRHAVGVCSRRDLAQRARSRRVDWCMTPFVITMLDRTTVADAIALALERDLRHVPVLSEGRVVGVVTPRAIIRWLAQSLRAARSPRGQNVAGGAKSE